MEVKQYYDDFEYLGKHYMVSACTEEFENVDVQNTFNVAKVRRHYTISNCMRKNFYDRIMMACDAYLNDKDVSQVLESRHLDEMSFSESSELSLTIKDYQVPMGISKQFFDKKLTKQAYEIKGPMGKGLGLNAESQGVHMAFAAGTGILVFVDVVARLILSSLEVIHESQRFHPSF